ncbi:MAG: hypothetical protein V5B33_06775 [Candidatus Accumulibacter sp. UW20]|jgi:hypothetical protein
MRVIATQFITCGGQYSLALWFWWPDAVLIFILGFAVLLILWRLTLAGTRRGVLSGAVFRPHPEPLPPALSATLR